MTTMQQQKAQLQSRFCVPDIAWFDEGAGDLLRLCVATEQCHAELYLHGAQVTRFEPAGQDHSLLFLSEQSQFHPDKPIRGGVPICFPWFAQHPQLKSLPAHGFARLMEWQVDSLTCDSQNGVEVTLSIRSSEEIKRLWTYEFAARLVARFSQILDITLEVDNLSSQPLRFEEALHTYFAVQDVREVSITGLENAEFFDRARNGVRSRQGSAAIRFTSETDRTYINTGAACVLRDPGTKRSIHIEKSGSRSTVVWNPWIEKARAMADFGADEWRRMVCIETANVGPNAVTLEPNTSHALRTAISMQQTT